MAAAAPDFAHALSALVARLGLGALADLRRLSGGASQETWAFAAGKASYVLRRAPGPAPSGSGLAVGLETEAALMRLAGTAGVPSPEVIHVLTDADGVGRGFIQNFVTGETLGGRIVKDPAYAEARTFLARQCGEVLARIHAIAPAAAPELPHRTPAEMLDNLYDGYLAEAWPRPVMELAFRWLKKRLPATPFAPKLVHGDFRNGNLIIGADGVRAVLDWEIAYVGDPMADLGWLNTNCWRFGMIDKPVGGFGLRADLFAGYESVSGEKVDPERVRFWEMMGSLRWGVMCTYSSVAFRAAGGQTPVDRPMIARRASENEMDLVDIMMGRD
jgi:aminoglycoside phosphotransferase (APT) family kinase protein